MNRLLTKREVWLLIIGIGLIVALLACGDNGDGDQPSGDIVYGAALPNRVTASTPRGVTVKSNTAINSALLPLIDSGLQKTRDNAAREYQNIPQHSQFTVGLWPRSPKCINPGFLINANGSPWDGTEFDKDPRPGIVTLCIAGISNRYGNNNGGDPTGTYGMLVVDDVGIMETIVQFEAEHEVLLAVDPQRWAATSGIHAHPLLSSGDGLVAGDQMKAEYKLGDAPAVILTR